MPKPKRKDWSFVHFFVRDLNLQGLPKRKLPNHDQLVWESGKEGTYYGSVRKLFKAVKRRAK